MKMILTSLLILSSALAFATTSQEQSDIRSEINAIPAESANKVYNLINQKVRTCEDIKLAIDGLIDQRNKLTDSASSAGQIYVTYQDRLASAALGMGCEGSQDTKSRFQK